MFSFPSTLFLCFLVSFKFGRYNQKLLFYVFFSFMLLIIWFNLHFQLLFLKTLSFPKQTIISRDLVERCSPWFTGMKLLKQSVKASTPDASNHVFPWLKDPPRKSHVDNGKYCSIISYHLDISNTSKNIQWGLTMPAWSLLLTPFI